MTHPYHPWVWPSPHNHLPLQSRPALTAESTFFHELSQDYTTETEIKFADTLLPTSCSAGEKSSGRSSAMPEDTTSPVVMAGIIAALFPKLCDLSSRREISAALMTLSTLPSSCWTGTSSGTSARKRKTSGGPCWNPSIALPIPSATGLFAFDGKTHSSPKAIARAFNRQFTACSAQQDWAIRRLLRNLHRHHRVDLSYKQFDERGVAAAIRKAGSSTAQGADGFTVVHLRHLGAHGLAFLKELFNLSVAGINIPAIWKNSVITPILKAVKPREQGRSYRPINSLFIIIPPPP